MKARSLSSLVGLASLVLTGCALPPKSSSPWQAASSEVSFRVGEQRLTLRKASAYKHYRVLSRPEFLKYRAPVEAASVYVGRQGRYNYDVFYLMEEDRGKTIYGFTFGKFDIEWPPYALYRIDRAGKVQALKVLP